MNVESIYNESAISYRYFLDWRHRMLLRLAFSTGATILLMKWLWDSSSIPTEWLAIPLIFLGVISSFYAFIDHRQTQIIGRIEKLNKALEEEVSWNGTMIDGHHIKGFYATIQISSQGELKHRTLFLALYIFISVGSIFSAIAIYANADNIPRPVVISKSTSNK